MHRCNTVRVNGWKLIFGRIRANGHEALALSYKLHRFTVPLSCFRFGLDIQGASDGLVPLLLVVSWGQVSLARWLLQKGAMRGMEDKVGNDALQIAFRLESEEGDFAS